MKYVFVSGGVISGIGKGTTSATIGLLLKQAGYRVAPIKFENYLNIDAGTINPIEHGDPFLCEDGTEADMDIGTYEKFLDENMGKDNFVTMGQIYKTVIERERRFEYMGEDVEAIPYITDEIINRIKNLGKKKKAEIVLVELGGTAGEYQNALYYEAARILTLKEPKNVIHIHVSYVPIPKHLGEPKTKPTQLSVRTLNSMGIQPDFLIVRSERSLDQRRIERLALFCNLQSENIINNPDVNSIYELPIIFSKQQLEFKILKKMGLKPKKANLSQWEKLISVVYSKTKKKVVNLAIVGKYFGTGDYQLKDSYAALFDAIDHAGFYLNYKVNTQWIDAEKLEKNIDLKETFKDIDGIIVPIGWGPRGAEGMIKAASYAFKNKIPYLGLCYGMQLSCIAFAREVLGLKKANTTENEPKTPDPIIHLIPKQEEFLKRRAYGGTMRLGAWEAKLVKDCQVYQLYKRFNSFVDKNQTIISERHRHRYEFNDRYASLFEKNGFKIVARSLVEGLAEIVEIDQKIHPFFIGTQGHPEYKSRPFKPHPLFVGFLEATDKHKKTK